MIVSPYTHDIDDILSKLCEAQSIAKSDNNKDVANFFEIVTEIVKEWKFDKSQLDFSKDKYYRQAVSFLMRLADETGKINNDTPEYFEDRFFNMLKCYKALESRFNERLRGDKN